MARIDTRPDLLPTAHSHSKSRRTRTGILIGLLWCAIIGLELFFLFNDITLFQGSQSEHRERIGKQIAVLRETTSGVRWQNSRDVLWNEGVLGQPMYAGQSVMTLTGARARLEFDAEPGAVSAGGIEIHEKSLVQLQNPSADASETSPLLLSLLRGKIQAETSRPILLSRGNFQIKLEPGAKFEAIQTDDAFRIDLRSGNASAVDSSGASFSVGSGQSLELPGPIDAPSTAPVVRDRENPTPLAPPAPSLPLPAPKMRPPVFRPRTSPQNNPGGWLRTPRRLLDFFSISSAHAVAATEWELELHWDAVPDAKAYRVQISRTRNFSKPLADETVSDPKWVWLYRIGMENSRGRVFYRVGSVDAEGNVGAFSDPVPYAIPSEILAVRSKPTPAPAPKPRAPVLAQTPEPPPSATASAATSYYEPPKIEAAPTSAATWSVRPSAELRSHAQTSDSSLLRRASPGGVFLHESLRIERIAESFLLGATVRASHFEKSQGPVAGSLPLAKTRSFEGRLSVQRRWDEEASGWRSAAVYGVSGFLEDRFEKSGPNTLQLAHAFSLGPMIGLRNHRGYIHLHLPITGALGSGKLAGPYGPTLEAQADWLVSRRNGGVQWLASASIEGSWSYWKLPEGTRTREWAVGFGPKVVFE